MSRVHDTSCTLAMPKGMIEQIDAIAERTGRSRAAVIRMALKRLIEQEEELDHPGGEVVCV